MHARRRDMSKEEPAWKAELREELRIALGASDIENVYVRRRAHDAVFPSMMEAVKAAEQRGREAALREAAEKIRDYSPEPEGDSLKHWSVARRCADLIDPDKA